MKELVFRGCTTIPLYVVCGLVLEHPKQAFVWCGNLRCAFPWVTFNRYQHIRFRRSCLFHCGRGLRRLVLKRGGRFLNETMWIRACGIFVILKNNARWKVRVGNKSSITSDVQVLKFVMEW